MALLIFFSELKILIEIIDVSIYYELTPGTLFYFPYDYLFVHRSVQYTLFSSFIYLEFCSMSYYFFKENEINHNLKYKELSNLLSVETCRHNKYILNSFLYSYKT